MLYQWQQKNRSLLSNAYVYSLKRFEFKQWKPFYIIAFIQKNQLGHDQLGFSWGHLMSKSVRNGNAFFTGLGFPCAQSFESSHHVRATSFLSAPGTHYSFICLAEQQTPPRSDWHCWTHIFLISLPWCWRKQQQPFLCSLGFFIFNWVQRSALRACQDTHACPASTSFPLQD